MQREQFVFYASFLSGISRIKNKQARCDAYDSIVQYALNGVEPDLDLLPDAAAIAFIMARPNIDASRKRAEAGRKGGSVSSVATAKQIESNPEANDNQTEANTNLSKGKSKSKSKSKSKGKEQELIDSGAIPPDGGLADTDPPVKKPRTIFRPPTVDEVAAYCRERHNGVDAQRFVDFYSSKGWLVGKTRMVDWRAAVRNWERRDGGPVPASAGGFLGLVEEMRGGDFGDAEGDGSDLGISGELVPADVPWPDR